MTLMNTFLRRIIDTVTTRYNQLQFVAYEGANAALFLHENIRHLQSDGVAGLFQQSPSALSALFFAGGSALIWLFHPKTRPAYLMYGGLFLTVGGICLIWAGFPLAGAAVVLASFETARGGMAFLPDMSGFPGFIAGASGLRVYQLAMSYLTLRNAWLDRWFNRRPFLVGAVIKTPLRADVILRGDLVTALVGASWALGDMFLALNDQAFRLALRRRCGLREES